ncbi:KPN_01571 family protein [Shigella flexneri]
MTHSKMNPFIRVLIILMTLDALREPAGLVHSRMAISVGLSRQ